MLQVIWINQEHSGPYQICMKLSDFCKVNWPNHCDRVIRHMVLDRSALCSHHNDRVGSVKNQSVCVVAMIMLDRLSINWLCVLYTTKPIDARPIGTPCVPDHNDRVGSVKNQSVCVVAMIMLDRLTINRLCVLYTTKPIDARPIGLVYPTTMIGLDRSRTNRSEL
jgi:hypothetical protein